MHDPTSLSKGRARLSADQIASEVLLLCIQAGAQSWVSGVAHRQPVFHRACSGAASETGWQAPLDRFTSI